MLDEATATRVAQADAEGWGAFIAAAQDASRPGPAETRSERSPEQVAADEAEARAWLDAMKATPPKT